MRKKGKDYDLINYLEKKEKPEIQEWKKEKKGSCEPETIQKILNEQRTDREFDGRRWGKGKAYPAKGIKLLSVNRLNPFDGEGFIPLCESMPDWGEHRDLYRSFSSLNGTLKMIRDRKVNSSTITNGVEEEEGPSLKTFFKPASVRKVRILPDASKKKRLLTLRDAKRLGVQFG